MQIQAHAKINLNLRILGKRSDGFHELETLMVPIGLHDILQVELSDGEDIEFSCSRTDLSGADNLIVRALRLLERHVERSLPVRIHLEKSVPSGAGLGGGSSDAAAALLAVRDLHGLDDVSDARLETIAAQLGSDIPFFIKGKPAICKGRGEVLVPHPFNTPLPLVLFKQPLDIPTPWAYQHWASSVELPGFSYAAQSQDWGQIVNDLERPAFAKYLILGEMKRWLLEQEEVDAAAMTGSGSALFAIPTSADASETLISKAKTHYGDTLWAKATKVHLPEA